MKCCDTPYEQSEKMQKKLEPTVEDENVLCQMHEDFDVNDVQLCLKNQKKYGTDLISGVKELSILKRADVNLNQFASDMQSVELDEMLEVSYFLAKRIGGKGTPTLVINNQVIPGYIPKNSILGMLK